MVAKIITGKRLRGALHYSENKVIEGVAELLLASGFAGDIDQMNFHQKLQRFENLTMLKPSVKTNTLHISLNFDASERIDDATMQRIAIAYMEKIGFGDQPYLAYRHNDVAHDHIHIVTTNIQPDGGAISLHNIGRNQSMKACRELETDFNLVKAPTKGYKPEPGIKPVDVQKALYGHISTKRAISNTLTAVMNSYKYTSLAELNAILKQFNVMADRGAEDSLMYQKRGLVYSLLDDKSNKVGVPIKASSLYAKPTLNNLEKEFIIHQDKRLPFKPELKERIDKVLRSGSSSRFGSANQFANFGAVGAAWIFSKERILHDALPFIDFGKLRGSYGTTGNDQIGNYQYLATYSPEGGGSNYLGVNTLYPTNLPNPQYAWETTRKLEFGLDLGFFDDRIQVNTNYYKNRSSNLLVSYPLPNITGGSSILENFPAVIQNSGWEFTVATTNIKSPNFKWSTSINFTLPVDQAKLLSYPGLANSSYSSSYVIGESILIQKVAHYTGVDPQTGLYTFQDYNKDGNITNPEDYQKIISTAPQFYGGISNSFSFKGFQLDFLLQFVERKMAPNILLTFGGSPGQMANIPEYVFDNRWQKPGDHATVQRLFVSNDDANNAYNNFTHSDGGYSNASFIRLKNVAFSYTLPSQLSNKIHMRNVKLFFQGQNLLTITNYLGLDPETLGGIPPLRVFTGGVQVGL